MSQSISIMEETIPKNLFNQEKVRESIFNVLYTYN